MGIKGASPQGGLGWHAKRLRVMRPAEMAHRLTEQCALRVMRAQHRMGLALSGQVPHDPAQFSFCNGRLPRLPKLPLAFPADDATVDALLAGSVHAHGCEWAWRPDRAVWHEAPDTRMTWPQVFFGLIPYRPGNPYGDIRLAWEPSRLQHLIALAWLARRGRPEIRQRAKALLEDQLLSWVEANPLWTGIHYISVMECALRILAVCHAVDMARGALRRPEGVWRALVMLVGGHAPLIARRTSLHSSLGNHTIAEAAALVYAGTLFPEMSGAKSWKATGLFLLEKEAARQILPDGGGAEQAFWYQLFVTDLVGLVVMLLGHVQEPVPTVLREAHGRGRDFLSAFADTPERLPPIGDGDQGYALSPFLRLSQQTTAGREALRVFPQAGYSVVRSVTGERATLIFDHGSLGMAPCYGHGHADALSVLFRLGEQEILLDPGTYTYNGDPRWRAYFRGTQAHNTVTVDGQDQAIQDGTFLWSQPFAARCVRHELTPEGVVRSLACHTGYTQRSGVTHWRAVVFQPPGFWLIWDRLTGLERHHVELNWHLGVDPTQCVGGYRLPVGGRTVRLTVEGGDRSLHRRETSPISGWRSPCYGVKEPITTLRTEFYGALPHEFVTQIRTVEGGGDAWVSDAIGLLRGWVDEAQAV